MLSNGTKSSWKACSLRFVALLLDVAVAKCQRALIPRKYQLVILRHRVMFCARHFFVVKYPRQLEMSSVAM